MKHQGLYDRRQITKLLLMGCGTMVGGTLVAHGYGQVWRQASDAELRSILPVRAPVGEEHIETEMRTASGITNGRGDFIAGVVMITTGYAANGKYSHFFATQVPIALRTLILPPGKYVLGWQHGEKSLSVHFYDAASEAHFGSAEATIIPGIARVESFRLWPPRSKSLIQIGRFGIPYWLPKP